MFAGEKQVEICQARFKEGISPCFHYGGEDDLGEIREDLEANGKVWGGSCRRLSLSMVLTQSRVLAGLNHAVLLSKYLDFLPFASKQSLDCACFSTESGEQFSTTQICTGGCTAAESRL